MSALPPPNSQNQFSLDESYCIVTSSESIPSEKPPESVAFQIARTTLPKLAQNATVGLFAAGVISFPFAATTLAVATTADRMIKILYKEKPEN